MSLKHTKSPSGKTHRLTYKTAHQPPQVTEVTLRYRESPQFDDQVQGDLLRKMQRDYGLAYGVGRLSTYIDPDLLDRDQKPHSLDYLRGYLAGLEIARGQGQQANRDAITTAREQIAKLEAQQTGISISEIAHGGPTQGPPPAAGAASVVIDQIQINEPVRNRLAEGVRRVKRAEELGGW